jgi:uncharacterized membrane protein
MIKDSIIQATEVIILALIVLIFTPIILKIIASIFAIFVIIGVINSNN